MSAVLTAEHVGRTLGGARVLHDVSVEARRDEILCVLGPSGSGKSTLLRLLHLLDAPDSGRVLVDGAPAPVEGEAWLATVRRFALVQQTPGLLRATAWENVAFPLRARGVAREEARATAMAWLARVGLSARSGARASTLSGGEAQRVALARALTTRPDVLLLDEATNQLDPESTREVEALLREERVRGCAIVLVTHNVRQARRLADRIAFLAPQQPNLYGTRALLEQPPAPLQSFLDIG